MSAQDWTAGTAAIVYQGCNACASVWYIRRGFCPRCGATHPETRMASGRGTVHAVTTVSRAPTEALRHHAPYPLLLVDAAEGFRLMAHGEPGLAIGDAVVADFRAFGGGLVPHFRREAKPAPDRTGGTPG
jgi:uncharacterized OB-fold protein